MIETWVPVKGFEGLYEISNFGNVKSCARIVYDKRTGTRTKNEKLLKCTQDSAGYLKVSLYKGTEYKEVWKVHRLVAKHFCKQSGGCNVVNHIDNNKTNNHWTNLEWTTTLGNNTHMMAQGRHYVPSGDESSSAKVTSEMVSEILALSTKGTPQTVIGNMYGISQQQISRIVCGHRWKNHPARLNTDHRSGVVVKDECVACSA